MRKATFGLLLIVMVVVAALAASTVGLAQAEISFLDVLTVRNSGDGYEYGNNGTFIYKDTLQEIVDEIASSCDGTVVLSFDEVVAKDNITFSAPNTFVLTGEISCTLTDTLLTISGSVRLQALHVVSNGAIAWVQTSGTLDIAGGYMATTSASFNATVINGGACSISDATLSYVTETPEVSGFTVYQSGQAASLTVNGGYLSGNSVLAMESGEFAINGGSFQATQSQEDNSENGYTLRVSNNAHGTLAGGSLYSVDPARCVFLRGGVGSSFDWQGGTLDGQIVLETGSPSIRTAFTVEGKTIGASQLAQIYLAADEGALTLASAKLGVYPTAGNYLVGWSDDVEEQHPSLDAFESDLILPVLSNMYTVGLVLGQQESSASLAYGATLDPFDYGIELAEGYEVVYWKDSDGEYALMPYTVQKNTTLTATIRIADFDLQVSEDIDVVYDGISRQLQGSWSPVDGLTYTCSWVLEDHGQVSTATALNLQSAADSGRYQLTVTASDGVLNTSVVSRWITVSIAKGEYQGISHEPLAGTYAPEQTLESFALQPGFRWQDPSTVPTVNVTSYSAFYCVDEANYNDLSLSITLNLQKAVSQRTHSTLTGDYTYDPAKTLADYQLEAGWHWEDEATVPQAGYNSYPALYNPDPVNYADYRVYVAIQMDKAHYDDVPTLSLEAAYREGLTINAVIAKTPGCFDGYQYDSGAGWSSTDRITSLGQHVYAILYNPDPANYFPAETTLTITVTKGRVEQTHPTLTATYHQGLTTSEVELNEGWRWAQESQLQLGTTELAAIYNPDPALFDDYSTTVTVNVVKGTIDPSTAQHPPINVVYREGLKLGDLPLNEGYAWAFPATKLNAGAFTYDAVYHYSDEYEDVHVSVGVEIAKGTVDVSCVFMQDEQLYYDGYAHTLYLQGDLPADVVWRYEGESQFVNVGEHEVTIAFGVIDPNYEVPTSISATLTILRATIDMSSFLWRDATFAYDGQPKYLYEAGALPEGVVIAEYVNNGGHVGVGNYIVGVKFSQQDTVNYYPVSEMQAILTIVKGNSPILGDTVQTFVYDGAPHRPNVLLGTTEQTLACDNDASYVEPGTYQYRYTTAASYNYNEGSKVVTMHILPAQASATGDVSGVVSDPEHGVKGELSIVVEQDTRTQHYLHLEITLDGQAPMGEYTIALDLAEFAGAQLEVVDQDGRAVSSHWEGNRLILQAERLGGFTITSEKGLVKVAVPAWVVAVSLISGILVGLAVAAGFFLKFEKDKLLALFGNKRGEKDEK